MIAETNSIENLLLDTNHALVALLTKDAGEIPGLGSGLEVRDAFEITYPECVGLHCLILSKQLSGAWPDDVRSQHRSFKRIMDRIYLPMPVCPEILIATLNCIANVYETLIDRNRNIGNIKRILEVTDRIRGEQAKSLLDFGCGTGLVMEAIASPFDACTVFGLDSAPRMLAHALKRGIKRVTWDDTNFYDIVIASYVLHGNTSQEDLAWIAQHLAHGGCFAGNYLHATRDQLTKVVADLSSTRSGRWDIIDNENWPRDPVLVFIAE